MDPLGPLPGYVPDLASINQKFILCFIFSTSHQSKCIPSSNSLTEHHKFHSKKSPVIAPIIKANQLIVKDKKSNAIMEERIMREN